MNCSICLCSINYSYVVLRCNHIYHYDCIKPWTIENTKCPECRKFMGYYTNSEGDNNLLPRFDELYEIYNPKPKNSFIKSIDFIDFNDKNSDMLPSRPNNKKLRNFSCEEHFQGCKHDTKCKLNFSDFTKKQLDKMRIRNKNILKSNNFNWHHKS